MLLILNILGVFGYYFFLIDPGSVLNFWGSEQKHRVEKTGQEAESPLSVLGSEQKM